MSRSPECPICGASLAADRQLATCPACGAPLAESALAPSPADPVPEREIQSLAASMNDQLTRAGAEIADRAFNLGCGMSFFALLLLGILVYFIGGRSWLLVFIALVPTTIAALWGVILLTDTARRRAIQRVYREEVKPKIQSFNRRSQVSNAQFDEIAYKSLPESAPLLQHTPPPPGKTMGTSPASRRIGISSLKFRRKRNEP